MLKRINEYLPVLFVVCILTVNFFVYVHDVNVSTVIIIDSDIIGRSVEVVGTWSTSTSIANYYGTNYRYNISGTGIDKIRWRPNIITATRYNVYYWLPAGDASSATNAKFTVYYNGGSTQYEVNEQGTKAQWILLGQHPFAAGKSGYVELSDNSNGNYVIADAIKFEEVSSIKME